MTRTLAPGFATTEDLMFAADCTRRTIAVWMNMGLLPRATRVSLGSVGGMFNRYPSWAIERARFIAAKRKEGYTYEEVRAMVDEQEIRSRGGSPAERAPAAKRSRGK